MSARHVYALVHALAVASLLVGSGICSLAQTASTTTPTASSGGTSAQDSQAAEQAKQLQQTADNLKQAVNPQPKPARAAQPPLGDYVPCLFDAGQNYELREHSYRDDNATLTIDQIDGILKDIPDILKPPALPKIPTDAQKAENAAATNSVTALTADLKAVEGILPTLTPEQLASLAQQLGTGTGLSADQLKLLNAYLLAVNPASTYDRPNDVSCSFSVLQWKETKDVFGRRVANDYVALEVNLRNLNTKNEFLVHDIQIAVDTGLTPYQFGRFEATRDKQLVRGVVQRGQSEDRRNLIINSLTAAGAILSPVSAAIADAGRTIASGVSIFQGPFLVGANNVFPDHTIEYLNNLNDLGFSPSSTNKTVVPVQGSVPLVTFLAEKPLEQLPFVRCGREHPWAYRNNDLKTEGATNKADELNLPNAMNCQLHPDYNYKKPIYDPRPMHDDVNVDDTLTGYFQKPLRFKDWDGAAQNIFGHRVFVVIGGVHIQQVASGPAITNLTCPLKSDQKSVDTSKDPVTCTLSGGNLDEVASIKLEQGSLTPIAGTLTAYASGNTATISFKASDVATAKANGSYELFLTPTAGGKDIDSKQALTFTTCTTVPSAPTGLAATASSSSVIGLTWTADTAPSGCTISSYSVYRSTTSGFTPSSTTLVASGLTSPSYSNTGLAASTAYYFVVEPLDADGTSAASAQATAATR